MSVTIICPGPYNEPSEPFWWQDPWDRALKYIEQVLQTAVSDISHHYASVSWLVGHTLGFPFCQHLWALTKGRDNIVVANMEVNMVADMELGKVNVMMAEMEVDMVAGHHHFCNPKLFQANALGRGLGTKSPQNPGIARIGLTTTSSWHPGEFGQKSA